MVRNRKKAGLENFPALLLNATFDFSLKNPYSVRQTTENSERLRKHDLVRCFSL
jgi:hypothetical protein